MMKITYINNLQKLRRLNILILSSKVVFLQYLYNKSCGNVCQHDEDLVIFCRIHILIGAYRFNKCRPNSKKIYRKFLDNRLLTKEKKYFRMFLQIQNKYDQMEQNLQELFQMFGLPTDNQAMKAIYQIFIKPQSLYEAFKSQGLMANDIDLNDGEYASLLAYLMQQYKIVQLKRVEIVQAWIIYSTKARFEFKVDLKIMLQKVQKLFTSPSIPLHKYLEFIVKAEIKVYSQQKKWLLANESQIKDFCKEIEQNQMFALFTNSRKEMQNNILTQKLINKQDEIPMMKELVYEKKNQVNQFERLQLQNEGKLIFSEYHEMQTCENLLELQVQKYIVEYFIKIYKNIPNYNVKKCNVYEKQLPLKLISIKDLIFRMQQEKRLNKNIQQNLQKIACLSEKILSLQNQKTFGVLMMNSYQEMFRIWNVVKESLNILNISFLNHLIRNTEKSISHIKDKNILLLIGPSGAGKTTIILRLLGYELRQSTVNGLFTLLPASSLRLEHSELITSPQAKSTTKFIFSAKINPELLTSRQRNQQQQQEQTNKKQQQEWFLCDTPGFFDTSGPVVDIANGVGMINAVKSAKRVKPIVVISANMVGEKFEGIKQIGKIVSDLFLQYRKKEEGGSTAFIFNKFDKDQQFNRIEPGTVNILKNLTPNEQSDGKYVRFLQVLSQKLRKKNNILKFDPFKIDIKGFIEKLSDDLIQRPEDVFKYSFSTKSVMTLRSYFQNKINIINHLLNFNISHAYYHIKQLKQLLEIVPSKDFQAEFDSLIKKISNITKEYFMRFKYILNEELLKNAVNSYEIEQLRQIYNKLTLYSEFNSIPQIQCYQKTDLDDLIQNASQNLSYTLKTLKFSFSQQNQYKKTLKIIKSFSENFNRSLGDQIKRYLKVKYQLTKAQVERLAISNSFKQCRQIQQYYQSICNYYQMIEGQAKTLKRFDDIMNERYVQIKTQVESYLKDNSLIDSGMQRSLNITWKAIIELDTCYANLQNMQIIYLSKARQDNLKHQITKYLVNMINFYSTKCQEIINSKQICPENILKFTRYRDSIHVLSSFRRLKQECEQVFKGIGNSINRLLELELASLEKITDYMARNGQFSSKLASFDLSLFRIKSFSMLSDNLSLREKLQNIKLELFIQLDKTIKENLQKVKCTKINIRSNLKFDEINALIRRQSEVRYLKNIKDKQSFDNQEIGIYYFQEQVRLIEEQCKKQLNLPFMAFNQSFSTYLAQDSILRNSKKHLHQLNSFLDYRNYLAKMMSLKDYQRNINLQQRQKYVTNFMTFMKVMQKQIQKSFIQIKQKGQLIYILDKQVIMLLKKKIDLLSFILKNQNIENQMKKVQLNTKMSQMYSQFITMLEKNQILLKQEFYQIKNGKQIEYKLKELHEKCYKMKQFDRQLGQEDNFAEIFALVNAQFSLRQVNAINKLVYIFNESSVNFVLLQDFYTNNLTNPEIVHEILQKIRQYDHKFFQQIEGIKKFNDKLFEDDNMHFVKIVFKTFNYYRETRNIVKGQIEDQNAILNMEYFKLLMEELVENYIQFFNKLMQLVFKFSFKQGIPQHYQDFFQKLEQLTKKLFPKDYDDIRQKIMSVNLQLDISLQVGDDISILSYICRINNRLISEIQRNFTKLINVFHPSSTRYYQYLQSQQKDQYIHQLRERFDQLMQEYQSKMEKEGLSPNDQNKEIYQHIQLVPQMQISKRWKIEIQSKRDQYCNKIQKAKLHFDGEMKNAKRSFKEMHSIYQKMSGSDKSRYKTKLRDVIVQDFQALVNSNMQLQDLFKEYRDVCKYYEKEQISKTQFCAKYEESRKSFLQILSEQIIQVIKNIQNCILEDTNAWSLEQTLKKSKSLIQLYLLSVQQFTTENDLIEDINRYIETYINFLITLFRNEQFINKIDESSFYEVDVSKLQKSIKTKCALTQLLLDINQDLNSMNIRRYRYNSVSIILQFFNKSEENQLRRPFDTLLKIMLNSHQQIQRFQFDSILKQLEDNGDSFHKYHFQMEKLSQKLFFLQKFHQIYYKLNLSRFRNAQIMEKSDIFNCSRLAEKVLQRQKGLVLQEMKDLFQQSLTHRLSFRFAILMELCQVMKFKIRNETDPFYFINEIRQTLLKAFNNTINFNNGQPPIKQTLTQQKSYKNSMIQNSNYLRKQEEKRNLDRYQTEAKTMIRKLVILEKMLSKSYPQQNLKKKISQYMENIKNSSNLMPLVLKQLKQNLCVLEIKKIASKYRQLKPIFEVEFYENTKKQLTVFLNDLKRANQNMSIDVEELKRQYKIYQDFFKQTRKRYQNDPSQQTIKALSKEIIDKVNKEGKLNVLGRIFGLYSILKSRQTSQGFAFHPHLAQIIAIILILEDDHRNSGIKSCLLEIQTGQGKSIVLAGVACFLALKGHKVYQLCYSKYLVKRDYQNFKELFVQLQVQDKIEYTVFQNIFKMIISKGKNEVSFEEYLKHMLNKDHGIIENVKQFFKDIGNKFASLFYFGQKKKSILLMDEIDVIFSEQFQGQIYFPLISFTDNEGQRQIRDIFMLVFKQSTLNRLSLQRIQQSQQYKNLLKKYSNIESIIKDQIKKIIEAALNRQQIALESQNIKKNQIARNIEGESNYKEMFAYLLLKQKSQLVNDKILRKKLRINLKYGQFSYSELPKCFERIIGVTGTLKCLSSRKKRILSDEYSIKNMYYIPSIYQKQVCQVEKDYKVCVNQQFFFEILLKKIKIHFNQAISSKRAMIIFFKDKRTLQSFSTQLFNSSWRNFSLIYLDEKPTDDNFQQINDKVGSATSQNTLTLAIRQFTRGIDYKDFVLTDGLYVVQTYLPDNYEDFMQSRGRTARAGRKGRFMLLLNSDDLKSMGQPSFQMSNIEAFWEQIDKDIEKKREIKRQLALKKHQKTQSEYNNNNLRQYVEEINRYIKKDYFILVCFQGTLNGLRQLCQRTLKILQNYQNCIKKLQLNINIKIQFCMFGNYQNLTQANLNHNKNSYQDGNNLIIKQSQISQDIEKLRRFVSSYAIPGRSSKGEGLQSLLRHIKRKGQKMHIDCVFLWNDNVSYSWEDYTTTTEYKRVKDHDGIKPYIIKKQCAYYLDEIAKLKIHMTFMMKGSLKVYKQQIEKLSEPFGKSSLRPMYHIFNDKELNDNYNLRIKQIMPQLDTKQANQCLQMMI